MTRAFARLWTASLFSEIAEWMLQIALPVYIYQATGSAGSTALAMAAGVLPMILLSPVAGFVADRCDRGRTLSLVCAGQALTAVPLLVYDQVWLVYAVMLAQSSAATLFEPARNALIPQIVRGERIVSANGWMGFNSSGARLLGSSAGGILLATGGLTTVIVSYLGALVVAAALLVRRFHVARTPVVHEPMWRAWLGGLTEFRRERRLRLIGAVLLVGSVAQGMFLVLFVVFVTGPLGGGEAQVGLLRGAQAIGGLVAGVVVGTSLLRRLAPETMTALGGTGVGVLTLAIWNLPGLTTGWTVYFVLFAVVGVPSVLIMSGSLTVLQTAGEPGKSGRVLASTTAMMAVCQTAGMLLAGPLADVWNLTALLNLHAVLMLLSGLPALAALWSTRRAARLPQGTASAATAARPSLDH
ncbi:MFS transporter [Kibdelosporangium phytohabitans]|uniref:MFS transporter n=1 Tax=Kibdelosporangium phytohabitans TaxID=860235 RepID=A0A0N9HZY1_9PSEU|nr:MFS transporter [Kibdelosporangium phytohabitans]ALG11338.1 MFS transporter [Kibdelosporangium phytohabitans]MBE1462649.1 MFS family permease [Kibdelosporangium phytohabitans]